MVQDSYGTSDPGRVRREDQDAILRDDELGVYIVCDGGGSQRAGGAASDLACRTVHERLLAGTAVLKQYAAAPTAAGKRAVLGLIAQAAEAASRAVCEASRFDADKAGMTSTLVLAAMLGQCAVVAHAGNSRCYLLRGGGLHLLTEDHTMARDYVKMGLLSPQEEAVCFESGVLTRCLGAHEKVQTDMLHFELVAGDELLLCTDGLTAHMAREEMAALLTELTPQGAVEEMVRLANDRGGRDNISAIVVRTDPTSTANGAAVTRRLAALRRVPVFQHLNSAELLSVLDLAQVADYPGGAKVIAGGGAGQCLFVSVAGTARVVKGNRTLAVLPPGSLFGEMALLDQRPRSADVLADGPLQVLAIGREDLFAMMRRDRSLAVKVLWGFCQVLNERLRAAAGEGFDAERPAPAAPEQPDPAASLDMLARAARPYA